MKKFMNYSLLLLLCSALFVPRIQGVTSVVPNTGGGATAGQTFQTAVQAAAYYKPTSTMFFGLANGASSNAIGLVDWNFTQNDDFALTYTGIAWTGSASIDANAGPSGSHIAYTTAQNGEIQSSNITALAVVGNPTSDATRTNFNEVRIVFLSSKDASTTMPRGVHVMTPTLGIPVWKPLNDAAGSSATVNTMTLVAGNAGTKSYAFCAVKTYTAAGDNRTKFGANGNDGVVAVGIDLTTNAITVKDESITTPLVLTSSTAIGGIGGTSVGAPAMTYDETLRRLYVGQQYRTNTSHPRAAGFGVNIFDVDASTGLLTPLLQAGTSAGAPNPIPVVATDKNIIATKGAEKDIAMLNLKVMHTSTGPDAAGATKFAYLIVNGGNGAAAAVGNQVWAIPLVVGATDGSYTAGATTETDVYNGTFANVNTANFISRASASGDLYQTTTAAARVGGGPLPCPVTTSPAEMWVDGDAVYCSIDAAAGATITPGVFHSQCVFNEHGQIDHWTEWARVSPNELGGITGNSGRVGHFSVDAASTRMMGVDQSKLELRVSGWEKSSFTGATTRAANATGLLTVLNSSDNVGKGCTAVCDLNSSSTTWGATTPMRMTLFGGLNGKVCFALTGSAGTAAASLATTNTALNTYVDYDYSTAAHFKATTVSANNAINTIAYSGWPTVTGDLTPGFFFAGTEEDGGLYAYCATSGGAGFNSTDVLDFLIPPFRASSWQKIAGVTGYPQKILSRGGATYILSSGDEDKIYRLTRQSTLAELATDLRAIATTKSQPAAAGVSDLSSVTRIYDFVITVTASSEGANTTLGEQLMMLTDDGIYTTTSSIGTSDLNITAANGQLLCGWVKMDSPDSNATWQSFFVEPAYTRSPQTFWFGRNEEHSTRKGTFTQGTINQLNRKSLLAARGAEVNDGDTAGNWALNPTLLNGFDGTAVEPSAFDQFPHSNTFYSDGSRRIFQHHSPWLLTNDYNLFAIPYETGAKYWAIPNTNSYEIAPAAMGQDNFTYWISTIGGTGKLLAGTGEGVIGLV